MPIDPNDMSAIQAFSDATARALSAHAADITALRTAVDNLATNLATHISNAPHAAPVDLTALTARVAAVEQAMADDDADQALSDAQADLAIAAAGVTDLTKIATAKAALA